MSKKFSRGGLGAWAAWQRRASSMRDWATTWAEDIEIDLGRFESEAGSAVRGS